ncbi:MAG: hypothetical protein HZA35_01740 [Parcubacteria group bacterium]|nr:hypothetical protein [Parcubacteria group bacterium]
MDPEHHHWFWRILDGFVSNPDKSSFVAKKGIFDLEIMIRVAREDKVLFTPEVLGALKVILTAKTGVSNLMIYLEDSEFARMKEAQSYM